MSGRVPPEPPCPADRKPHRDRVADIHRLLPEGKVGGVLIDNTDEHREWYLHEIGKYPRLRVEYQGALSDALYLIRVRKLPSTN
jgi:hypothetical protein